MALFVVSIESPGGPSRTLEVARAPWTVGRDAGASACINGPGIWDRHLTLRPVADEGWVIEVADGALARVAGEPIRRHRLRNGDVVEVGRFRLCFQLGPVQRRSLGLWSGVFWLLLGGLAVAQLACVLWLSGS